MCWSIFIAANITLISSTLSKLYFETLLYLYSIRYNMVNPFYIKLSSLYKRKGGLLEFSKTFLNLV